jgi:cystathionine beta-synthase
VNEHGVVKDESKSLFDQKNAQFHKKRVPRPKIMGSILENIGETPIVRLERLSKNLGIECELRTYAAGLVLQ